MWFYVVSANSEWSFTVVNPALFTCTRLSNLLLFSISISCNVAGFILARVPLIPHHNGAQATPNHKNLFSFCPLYAHPPPPCSLHVHTLLCGFWQMFSAGFRFKADSFTCFARGEDWINTASKLGVGGSRIRSSAVLRSVLFFILPAVLDYKGWTHVVPDENSRWINWHHIH